MRLTPPPGRHQLRLTHLEPRQLRAQTFSGTDSDGDLFTIKLTGPGTLIVNDTPTPTARLTHLALQSDTTQASKLTISVTPKTGGDGLAGEFFNSLYTANGINSQGFSIKSFTAKGAIDGATFRAATRIGTVTADAALGMIMFAGRTDGFGFPATLSGFDPFGRIDAITLKRTFTTDPQNFAFLDSAVCAPSIGTITINGRLDTEMGSSDGFGAKTFGRVTLKDSTGTTVKPIIPTAPGDFGPFINNGDFIFRVYA